MTVRPSADKLHATVPLAPPSCVRRSSPTQLHYLHPCFFFTLTVYVTIMNDSLNAESNYQKTWFHFVL